LTISGAAISGLLWQAGAEHARALRANHGAYESPRRASLRVVFPHQ